MKIIINESQLRLIVENEDRDDNLLDFTNYKDIDPAEWDDMFKHINKKKGGIYDGYYFDGDVDITTSKDVTELKYLVRVGGDFSLSDIIDSLPMLTEVGGDIFFNKFFSKIYRQIGEKELRKQINIGGDIYLK